MTGINFVTSDCKVVKFFGSFGADCIAFCAATNAGSVRAAATVSSSLMILKLRSSGGNLAATCTSFCIKPSVCINLRGVFLFFHTFLL